MSKRYISEHFDVVFCSDLQRSYKTAEIAFGTRFPIIKDIRLRECDYGDFTRYPTENIESEKIKRIKELFPNGESYEQTSIRIKNFLNELMENYGNKKVMIIGHRATQYGLEHYIKGLPLEHIVIIPWQWQAGWKYELM